MKVIGYAGGFYKNLLQWNPLDIEIKEEWKTLDKDWKSIGSPLVNPFDGMNPYIGDWRRIGELEKTTSTHWDALSLVPYLWTGQTNGIYSISH